ncbi:MAG: hypothetical protein SFT68_02410, partial [Rickettsiaceae bacterium]|nr:hypothetical protein [Rickettsiaceae bacterium]
EIDFILNTYRRISGDDDFANHNFLINISNRAPVDDTNPQIVYIDNQQENNASSDITELSEDSGSLDSNLPQDA